MPAQTSAPGERWSLTLLANLRVRGAAMLRSRLTHGVMVCAVCGLGSLAAGQSLEPVKVHILSGQSNMVGFGQVSGASTPGTLEDLTHQGDYAYMGSAGNWTVRDDVRHRGVHRRRQHGCSGHPRTGHLRPSDGRRIGAAGSSTLASWLRVT